MSAAYEGTAIDALPQALAERLRRASETAEKETRGIILVVNEMSESSALTDAERYWRDRGFGDYSEVYQFDGGNLVEAHYRSGDEVFRLTLVGPQIPEDVHKTEAALGLQVTTRPATAGDACEVSVDGDRLETLPAASHGESTSALAPNGPLLGRK